MLKKHACQKVDCVFVFLDDCSRDLIGPFQSCAYSFQIDKEIQWLPCEKMAEIYQKKLIRAARVLANLSQADLAQKAGIGRHTIMRLENAEPGIGIEILESLGCIRAPRSCCQTAAVAHITAYFRDEAPLGMI